MVRAVSFAMDLTPILQEAQQYSFEDWVASCISKLEQHAQGYDLYRKFVCTLGNMWTHRNNKLLRGKQVDIEQLVFSSQREANVLLNILLEQ